MKYERVKGTELLFLAVVGIPTYIAIIALFYKYDIFWLFLIPFFLIYDSFSQGHYLKNVRTKKYGKGSYVLRSLFYQTLFVGIVFIIIKYLP